MFMNNLVTLSFRSLFKKFDHKHLGEKSLFSYVQVVNSIFFSLSSSIDLLRSVFSRNVTI